MPRPEGYDKTQGYGGSRQLPAGGYVCVIKNAKMNRTAGGTDYIKVQIDIAEGEFKGYYNERYTSDKKRQQNPKWKGILSVWIYAQDGASASRSLNAFANALDDIGVDLWPDGRDLPDLEAVKNKRVGIVFRREEFKHSDGSGKTSWFTRPLYTMPVSDIVAGNFQVPDDKPLGKVEKAFAATDDDIPF